MMMTSQQPLAPRTTTTTTTSTFSPPPSLSSSNEMNHMYFTPQIDSQLNTHDNADDDVNSTNNYASFSSNQQAFDYFANLQS
ncbi:unnamed protein product, partial [Schistosoma turkestanicum]